MKFSKMGIDINELLLEVTSKAPHIRNTVEVERWIKTSAERIFDEYQEDVVPAIVRGERGEITQAEVQRAVLSKINSEIRKKLTLSAWDVSALDASANGKPIQIGDDTIDARSIVAEKLFQDSTGGWDESMSGYMDSVKKAQSKFYAKAGDFQLREMTKLNTKINTRDHSGLEDYPWFDPGKITLCKDKLGQVWLLDYTFPSEKDDADATYMSTPQRHIDKMSLKTYFVEQVFGVKVDKPTLIISKYLGNGRIEVLDQDLGHRVKPERAKEMLESADYYYKNNILEERLPQVDYGDSNYSKMEAMPPALKSALAKFVMMNKLKNVADKSAKSAKAVVDEIVVSQGGFSNHENGTPTPTKAVKSKVAAGPVSISNTRSLEIDAVKLTQAIKEKGEVPIVQMKDAEFLEALHKQYLSIEGTSIEDDVYLVKDAKRFTITRSAKHAEIDFVHLAEQLASDGALDAFEVLVDNFDLLTDTQQQEIATVSPTSPEEIDKFTEKLLQEKQDKELSSSDFDF